MVKGSAPVLFNSLLSPDWDWIKPITGNKPPISLASVKVLIDNASFLKANSLVEKKKQRDVQMECRPEVPRHSWELSPQEHRHFEANSDAGDSSHGHEQRSGRTDGRSRF
eukprot:4369117-Amphidinium_carterae.1